MGNMPFNKDCCFSSGGAEAGASPQIALLHGAHCFWFSSHNKSFLLPVQNSSDKFANDYEMPYRLQ